MTDPKLDRDEILRLHKEWWESNAGIDIPRMTPVFPVGASYLMFNANGHPYFGIDEKVKLWDWVRGQLDIAMPDIRIMRLTIDGDMAWLCCEGIAPVRIIGAEGTGTDSWRVGDEADPTAYDQARVRATEIYQRDDGEGNPVWKMWHFHASPLPAADEPRPGFGDTSSERGLGGIPCGTPERVVGL